VAEYSSSESMRIFYSLLTYVLTPVLLAYFVARGIRDRGWWKRWSERFGEFDATGRMQGIVVHAASVGEVNAAAPLIQSLQERWPDYPLTITCFTPTGSRRIRSLFGSSVHHVYAPIDLPGAVRRFLNHLEPRLLIIMETEIWPNLFRHAHKQKIPILISNARCSSLIAAQTDEDRRRFTKLGADRDTTRVLGNLKFDLVLPFDIPERGRALRTRWGNGRTVLVAGSSHEADERGLFEAFGQLLERDPEALLVIVPRYPERFEGVAEAAKSSGFVVKKLSAGNPAPADAQCLVIDQMGVLLEYYAAADIAFIGGTLARVGGHNPLEAAALGLPLIIGPNTEHIDRLTRLLLDAGAARQVQDAGGLFEAWHALHSDRNRREEMGRSARRLVERERGALERNLQVVKALLLK
jgi:3-deoxy-D-manno-octulosonic-acid transferase